MLRMKHIILLCIFLFISMAAHADEEIHQFEVTGEGATYKDALNDSLTNGISQIYGFKLKSEEVHQKKIRELSSYINDQSKSMGEIDINTQGKIDFKTEGFVQNYEVLSKSINSSDLHEVTVRIRIVKYKTPGISPHARRKIAVIPFWSTKLSFTLHYVDIPSHEISRQFSQKMVTELTQSRRFTVLDREYMEEFLREKNSILSSDSPVSELMKIGEVLGVDYLLIGTISEASQKETPYSIQLTGETGYEHSASFFADYRILVMATRQIKWADSVSLTFDDAEIKNMVPSLEADQIQKTLFESAAKQVVHRAMENIYPLRVVKVQANGEVILNQGGVSLADGDMLDVFSVGEQVVDPYTGEALGPAESWIATIEIVRVIPKMSFAKVIKGDSESIPNGSICRRIANEKSLTQRPQERATNIISSPSGGVYLPFDN